MEPPAVILRISTSDSSQSFVEDQPARPGATGIIAQAVERLKRRAVAIEAFQRIRWAEHAGVWCRHRVGEILQRAKADGAQQRSISDFDLTLQSGTADD